MTGRSQGDRPTKPTESGSDTSGLADLVDTCRAAGVELRVGECRWDVVLDRPERRNAQTPAMWRALASVGEAVARQQPTAVVLAGTGPAFSAGLDLGMLTGTVPGEPGLPQLAALPDQELDDAIAGFQRAFTWWRDVDAVTIAAVHGHAVGAGFQLALGCDIRVVADDVQFAMREVTLGLVPDLAGTGSLVEAVGSAMALELCATGRPVDAQEAVISGLANRAVPVDQLSAAVDQLVDGLLAPPSDAVAAVKSLLRGATGRSAEEQRTAERAHQARRLRELARQALAEEAPVPSR
ncbi:MAG TPA: enoyl-CoA hydratase/isomerase family protein [Actinomycetales bacterium]|nr:enoyl-CoA hydratase/isomerase family protein [Actinomycetales bacterium]